VKELTIDDIVEIHAIGIEMWGGDGSLRPDTRDRVDGALGAAIAAAMYAPQAKMMYSPMLPESSPTSDAPSISLTATNAPPGAAA